MGTHYTMKEIDFYIIPVQVGFRLSLIDEMIDFVVMRRGLILFGTHDLDYDL